MQENVRIFLDVDKREIKVFDRVVFIQDGMKGHVIVKSLEFKIVWDDGTEDGLEQYAKYVRVINE